MQKLFYYLIFLTIGVSGCMSSIKTDGLKTSRTYGRDTAYTWSNFFNNDCGLQMEFNINAADEAVLNYQCSNRKDVSQVARRHRRLNGLELWVASELPLEQLYRLSNGKCSASLIYLGTENATIKFPCALIHMTITCEIVSNETRDDTTRIQLKPRRALITYSDGVQEFIVNEKRFTPRGPFKPFKPPLLRLHKT